MGGFSIRQIEEGDVLAKTYFLILGLTLIVIVFNLIFGDGTIFFYLPFIIGGGGSLLYYLYKTYKDRGNRQLQRQTKILCHAFCSSVYIVGAFLLMVLYSPNFIASWSFHVWVVYAFISVCHSWKSISLILFLLLGAFMVFFAVEDEGLIIAAIRSIAIGGFWGFSFYSLLLYLERIIHRKTTSDI